MTDERFEQEDDIRSWMQQLAAIPLDAGPLPDARHLWWKAELLKRWDAQRRAVAPIDRAEPAQVGAGVTGAAVLLVSLWRYVPAANPTVMAVAIASFVLLLTIAVLTTRELV